MEPVLLVLMAVIIVIVVNVSIARKIYTLIKMEFVLINAMINSSPVYYIKHVKDATHI